MQRSSISNASTDPVVGWDVGGAHLKAALLQRGGRLAVVQRPCPLWLGLDRLADATGQVLRELGAPARTARHAVTMTGELADGFADRRDGVAAIVAELGRHVPRDRLHVFGVDVAQGRTVWHAPADAAAHWRTVASMNWWATAQWVAQRLPQALLVDIGSTTTDFIAVKDGRVRARGHDDHGRLASGELLYHGIVRTPLCALGPQLPFRDRGINLMNEFFATSADVYRLTGELDERHDQHAAADNGPKDPAGSRRRLARMVGLDADDATDGEWLALARAWRERQLELMQSSLQRVLAAAPPDPAVPLVAAGCGGFLAEDLGARTGRRVIVFESLLDAVEDPAAGWARVCAPCVAVAALLAEPAR